MATLYRVTPYNTRHIQGNVLLREPLTTVDLTRARIRINTRIRVWIRIRARIRSRTKIRNRVNNSHICRSQPMSLQTIELEF